MFNGNIPEKKLFKAGNEKEYAIERFLGILEDYDENPLVMYDIDVVCRDYREENQNPKGSCWKRENSYEWHPHTELVSERFEDFLGMLYSEQE